MKELKEINEVLDWCCQLELRQTLPAEQLVFMADATYQAFGYAKLIEDSPNQKYMETRQSYTPLHKVPRHLHHPKLKILSTQRNFYPFISPLKNSDTSFE